MAITRPCRTSTACGKRRTGATSHLTEAVRVQPLSDFFLGSTDGLRESSINDVAQVARQGIRAPRGDPFERRRYRPKKEATVPRPRSDPIAKALDSFGLGAMFAAIELIVIF